MYNEVMQAWFTACCRTRPEFPETSRALWESWQNWARTNDYYTSTPKRLAMFLRFKGLQSTRLQSGTVRAWTGVSLRDGRKT